MFERTRKRNKMIKAQQDFFHAVHEIWKTMPEDEGREFMLRVADPNPIIDWETGLELRDPCPRHPENELSSFAPPTNGQFHLQCIECSL